MTFETLAARDAVPDDEARRPAARTGAVEIVDVACIPEAAWADLAARSVEPNVFYHPSWARAVDAHARGRTGARALVAWNGPSRTRMIGLLPVVPAWRAYRLPLPVLVAWDAYAPVSVPLLDRERPADAARGLVAAASQAGAHALLLPFMTTGGPAAAAIREALANAKPAPAVTRQHRRACLDASVEAEAMLREAIGAKKLKELRRQRNRLGDDGEVVFSAVRTPAEIGPALDDFLRLEASGWKGARGTALGRDAGDAVFIRKAMTDLAACGQAEIVTLANGKGAVAAGLVLRQGGRAYFFKIAYDEAAAKMSPGVQLTLELTRHACGDRSIAEIDSIAIANHPMIDHIWRDRLDIADVLVPTRPGVLPFNLINLTIAARHALRQQARRVVHAIRPR